MVANEPNSWSGSVITTSANPKCHDCDSIFGRSPDNRETIFVGYAPVESGDGSAEAAGDRQIDRVRRADVQVQASDDQGGGPNVGGFDFFAVGEPRMPRVECLEN